MEFEIVLKSVLNFCFAIKRFGTHCSRTCCGSQFNDFVTVYYLLNKEAGGPNDRQYQDPLDRG